MWHSGLSRQCNRCQEKSELTFRVLDPANKPIEVCPLCMRLSVQACYDEGEAQGLQIPGLVDLDHQAAQMEDFVKTAKDAFVSEFLTLAKERGIDISAVFGDPIATARLGIPGLAEQAPAHTGSLKQRIGDLKQHFSKAAIP